MANDAEERAKQTEHFTCASCKRRLGGVESLKSGVHADGVVTARVTRVQDGWAIARCRCGTEQRLPLRIHIEIP